MTINYDNDWGLEITLKYSELETDKEYNTRIRIEKIKEEEKENIRRSMFIKNKQVDKEMEEIKKLKVIEDFNNSKLLSDISKEISDSDIKYTQSQIKDLITNLVTKLL